MPKSTAILCRTNAPLIKCAFDLIRKGRSIKVKIIGRDVAKNLKDIIGEVLDKRRNADIAEFNILLEGWINAIRQKFADSEAKEAKLAEYEDFYGCLKAIADQCDDAIGLFRMIDQYFVDAEGVNEDDGAIIFASGHRSKGLEWDRVIILRPDLMPHPGAETDADKDQEEHIRYVMETRGRTELWMCFDKHPE